MFHLMRQAYVLGNRGRRLGIYSCLNRYVTVSAKARNGLHGSMLAATPRFGNAVPISPTRGSCRKRGNPKARRSQHDNSCQR